MHTRLNGQALSTTYDTSTNSTANNTIQVLSRLNRSSMPTAYSAAYHPIQVLSRIKRPTLSATNNSSTYSTTYNTVQVLSRFY